MIDLHEVLDTPDKRISVGNFWASHSDFGTSLRMFQSALDRDPDNVTALANGAFMYLKIREFAQAEAWIERALALAPDAPQLLGIQALIVQESVIRDPAERFHIARALFEKAIAADPANITTLLNFAYMLQLLGDFQRAAEIYTRARDLNVMDLSTRFQRAMCLLTLARAPHEWREAWDEYEIRHMLYQSNMPNRMKPMYTGMADGLGDDSLLIVCEQGIGDTVMAARYVRFFKHNRVFRHVYMLCRPGQEALFERVDAIDGAYSDVNQVPPFDFYIPALSLMRVECWPDVQPSAVPYLRSYSWGTGYLSATELCDVSGARIGLCWAGNPEHGNDRWRSIGPDLFSDAFTGVPAAFYSLQQPHDNHRMPQFARDLGISTLDRLTEVISDMDLVITVDTSILHIAGALGIPTLALIPSNPDWRWQTSHENTAWYPSVRLFRADAPLNWAPVLARVRSEVQAFVAQRDER